MMHHQIPAWILTRLSAPLHRNIDSPITNDVGKIKGSAREFERAHHLSSSKFCFMRRTVYHVKVSCGIVSALDYARRTLPAKRKKLKYRNVCEILNENVRRFVNKSEVIAFANSSNRVSIIPATAIYLFIYAIIADLLQVRNATRGRMELSAALGFRFSVRLSAVHWWVLARSNQDPHSIAVTMNQTSPGILPGTPVLTRLSREPSDIRAKSREIKFRAVACAPFGIIGEFSRGPRGMWRIRNDKAGRSIRMSPGWQFLPQSSIGRGR